MKATKFVFRIALILVLTMAIVVPVVAQTPAPNQDPQPQVQVPEAVLLIISAGAGGLCVKVVNFLKEKFGWVTDADKIKNVWLTFGVSGVMGVVLLLITNSFLPMAGPETLITWITLAFTTATLIYKTMSHPAESSQAPEVG